MSLIASCKACEAEPWAWLNDAHTQFPRGATPESRLPVVCLKTHPEHKWTIADRRRQERYKKDNLSFTWRLHTINFGPARQIG
ncbi:MAG: transposase domain-containing protein [Planctomycetaceae bacterium]|nr:transposase domain-containing protein [Planctomycetaceae bacterium]